MQRADTQGMQHHLDEIAATIAPGAHAVVVLDQAGWHSTGKLRIPATITLLPLPARSPELNRRQGKLVGVDSMAPVTVVSDEIARVVARTGSRWCCLTLKSTILQGHVTIARDGVFRRSFTAIWPFPRRQKSAALVHTYDWAFVSPLRKLC
jgi:hypothetical protein